jgi:hypothetical protein
MCYGEHFDVFLSIILKIIFLYFNRIKVSFFQKNSIDRCGNMILWYQIKEDDKFSLKIKFTEKAILLYIQLMYLVNFMFVSCQSSMFIQTLNDLLVTENLLKGYK